jgi:hypothetical protein
MSDRDYSVRLDAPQYFRVNGLKYPVTILPEAVEGEVGYYSIGNSVVLELVGTVHTAGGPDFSSALNALRAEVLKGN